MRTKKFHEKFSKVFERSPDYADVLKRLKTLEKVENVRADKYFQNFLEKKYIVKRTNSVSMGLKSFLADNECEMLVHVLRLFFHEVVVPEEQDIAKSCQKEEKASGEEESIISASLSSMSDLMKRAEKKNPKISKIVIHFNTDEFTSLDFNDDYTEMSLANGHSYVWTIHVGEEKITCDYCQEEITGNFKLHHCFKEVEEEGEEDEEEEEEDEEEEEENEEVEEEEEEEEEENKEEEKVHRQSSFKKTYCQGPVFALKYRTKSLNDVLVSSNEKIELINTATKEHLAFKDCHTNSIVDIDVDSTGYYFATASRDNTACVWSFKKTAALMNFVGHTDALTVVKFHPSGNYIVTASVDTTIRLWCLDKEVCKRIFVGHKSEICCITFSPDGKMLASGDLYGIIKVWNIENGKNILEVLCCDTCEMNISRVTSLCFSPDNSLLACSNYKGIFKVFNIRNPEESSMACFKNTPLLIKVNKYVSSIWDIIFKENKVQSKLPEPVTVESKLSEPVKDESKLSEPVDESKLSESVDESKLSESVRDESKLSELDNETTESENDSEPESDDLENESSESEEDSDSEEV